VHCTPISGIAAFNLLNAELNPIRHLLALAVAHHFELNPIRHLLALAGAHHFELNPISHLLALAGAHHFVPR
jgi:hypothetical protein